MSINSLLKEIVKLSLDEIKKDVSLEEAQKIDNLSEEDLDTIVLKLINGEDASYKNLLKEDSRQTIKVKRIGGIKYDSKRISK